MDIDTSKITRVVVITPEGRLIDKSFVERFSIQIQDDGKTIKLFVNY